MGTLTVGASKGAGSQIMDTLRGGVRVAQGQKDQPSADCVDSHSMEAATHGNTTGYDGNKKIKGRKRHVLVDTLGLFIVVVVTAAAEGDREGSRMLLHRRFKSASKKFLDIAYVSTYVYVWR
jgi:putative transposase